MAGKDNVAFYKKHPVLPRRKANRKNLRKTTKKGAYKPARKKQMAIRRAPMTEQKTRETSDLVSAVPSLAILNTLLPQALVNDQAYNSLPLPVLTYMVNGTDEPEMIGRSIFAKYLTMKLEIKFPTGVSNEGAGNVLASGLQPRELYLIHGFVKTSPNLTSRTDTTPDKFEYHQATGDDDTAMNLWLASQIQPYFDDRQDKLLFIPKQNANIKILKYQKIVPNLQRQWDAPLVIQSNVEEDEPDKYFTAGSIPLVNRTIKWPMMRKYHYEKGTAPDPSTDADFYYPNTNQWIPFACFYNPMFADYAQTTNLDERVNHRSNQILYYTDS